MGGGMKGGFGSFERAEEIFKEFFKEDFGQGRMGGGGGNPFEAFDNNDFFGGFGFGNRKK